MGTDLRDANLTDCLLQDANLKSALYSANTQFSPSFDPVLAGMKRWTAETLVNYSHQRVRGQRNWDWGWQCS